ncbi:MAG: phosphatase [Defluviitaleaceae bacterium]|nr:phosphatase [Defluviitaleaceae bacterium]
MNFVLDLHCHTISSGHAYSTLTENAAHAAATGLTHLGIADHGPNMPGGAHLFHFMNLNVLPDTIHGVTILKGMEANIITYDGELDLPKMALERMDFVIASLHRVVIPSGSRGANTRAIVNAMQNPNVHIIGHPNDVSFDIEIEAVVEAAAKTRTIIEVNNSSLIPGSFRFDGYEDIEKTVALCKEYGVNILASSDAHFSQSVGQFDMAKPLIEASGIAEEFVVNTSAERLFDAIQAKKELFL